MDIHRLEIFCRAIELKSFTKAAEACRLSQPTVSEHIRTLESGLGVVLIDRLGREILPTEPGRILYRYAKKILKLRQEAMEAIEEYSGSISGNLLLGASTIPGTYILPRLIGRFKECHPEARITMHIENSRTIADGVAAGDLDCGVVGAQWPEPGLAWEKVFADELTLVVPPGHRWAGLKGIRLDQLATEPFIGREPASGTRKVMEEIISRHGFDPRDLTVIAELGSTEAVRQGVKAGLGITILSHQAVSDDLEHRLLAEVPIEGVDFSRPFYLVTRKNRYLPPTSRLFITFLRQGGCGQQR